MALLIVYDGVTLFRSRRMDVRSRWGFLIERAIRGLSSIFHAAKKYGLGWLGQVILIGCKCLATLTVKLNYAPNENSIFFFCYRYIHSIRALASSRTWFRVTNTILYDASHYTECTPREAMIIHVKNMDDHGFCNILNLY